MPEAKYQLLVSKNMSITFSTEFLCVNTRSEIVDELNCYRFAGIPVITSIEHGKIKCGVRCRMPLSGGNSCHERRLTCDRKHLVSWYRGEEDISPHLESTYANIF